MDVVSKESEHEIEAEDEESSNEKEVEDEDSMIEDDDDDKITKKKASMNEIKNMNSGNLQLYGMKSESNPDENQFFARPEIQNNSVYETLMKTSDGKSVFKFYIRNGSLDKNTRNLMVRLIIDNEKNRQFDPIYQQGQPRRLKSFSISKEQFNTWSDEAVILFPGTSKTALYTPYRSHRVQESMPDGQIVKRVQKIKASGSFVNHLSYTQGQLKEKHLTTDPWQHIEAPVVRDANEEEQTAVDWLSHHLDPDDQVKIKWDQSFGIRQQKLKSGNYQLHEYYKDFPCLEVAIGAELLSSDFNKIYPDAADKLFDRWEIGLYEIILPIGSKCSRQTLELLGQVEHAITLSNENHQPN
ncbi:hypothetical protein HCN44_000832 [Aphidius gifuensis]|uniref:Uncharacterized protein n=1 Tax=Aphidius gifuensis TaxID=684658 RepID=A0A834XSV6_APHGI|nr:hypothetical protein HCN44_000832 [Aphidius gifuensis]